MNPARLLAACVLEAVQHEGLRPASAEGSTGSLHEPRRTQRLVRMRRPSGARPALRRERRPRHTAAMRDAQYCACRCASTARARLVTWVPPSHRLRLRPCMPFRSPVGQRSNRS
jgi:hypothetical protein